MNEGQYALTVRVVDTFNNERTRQWGDYGVDHTGPTVTLTVAPDDRPLQGEVEVELLEDIRIRLRDAVDADPAITDITLSGGPQHDTVHLAWRQEDDNWYLEYPVMFPSLETGDYQLRVTAPAILILASLSPIHCGFPSRNHDRLTKNGQNENCCDGSRCQRQPE